MKRYDVAALGEVLIDFTRSGESEQGNPLFEANPGGAPANALAMLRKLGRRCALIGKVGADSFGDQLEDTLRAMLRFANTAAWFVTTRKGAIRAMPDPDEVRRILRD